MWFNEWCKRWLGRATNRGHPPPAPRRGLRPRLEQLEDRAVPANFTAASVSDLIADIKAANANTDAADTITLEAGMTFSLTAVDNTTDGATGLPVIAAGEDLTIVGNGDIIERSKARDTPAFRLFDVAAGASLTLERLTLQGGLALGYACGGAVYNRGALALHGVTVQNNTAQGYDGVEAEGPFGSHLYFPGGSAWGGGVYSTGSLQMEGCTIQNNAALGGPGYSSYFTATDGGNAYGGGVYVGRGTATITGSSITHNTAKGGDGGQARSAGAAPARAGQGVAGGISIDPQATVILDSYTVAHTKHNKASTSASDIYGPYTESP
jgi:hypothetical protein